MEKSKGLVIVVVTGLLIGSSSIAKAERTRRNDGEFGGTFLSTRMDLNDDGALAAWSTAQISGRLGKRTTQSVVEAVPTGPTPECPGGVSCH